MDNYNAYYLKVAAKKLQNLKHGVFTYVKPSSM